MARTSYDVLINSQQYLVVKDSNGVPQVELGATPKEPAGAGELVTLGLSSFHRGPGPVMDQGDNKYHSAGDYGPPDVSVPYALYPAGSFGYQELMASSAQTGFMGGAFRDYVSSAVYLYWILPKAILRYTPSSNTLTSVQSAPSGKYFTGSRCKFGGKWWFGVETEDRISDDMVTFNPGSNAWSTSSVHASHVFTAKNKMWWVENKGLNTAPEASWSEESDLSTPAGPYPIDTGGFCTWLHVLGPYMLVFKQDGNVYGVDEDGVWVPVIKGNTVYWSSPLFGHGSLEFRNKLVVPALDQLIVIDAASLSVTDIHPNLVQPGNPHAGNSTQSIPVICRLDATLACVLPAGNDICGWRLDEYPEGLSWNMLFRYRSLGEFAFPQAALQNPEAYNSNRLYVMMDLASLVTEFRFTYLSSADRYYPPTVLPAAGYCPSVISGFLIGSGAASGVTKKFVRVRGYASGAGWSVGLITSDGGSATNCGTTTAAGFFAFDVPSAVALARGVQVQITQPPTTDGYNSLSFPLFVDCYAAPASTDDMAITILASQEQLNNQGGAWKRRNSKDIYDAFTALVGTSTTLKWGGSWSGTEWTVLVLRTEMVDIEGESGREEGAKALKVFLRRL